MFTFQRPTKNLNWNLCCIRAPRYLVLFWCWCSRQRDSQVLEVQICRLWAKLSHRIWYTVLATNMKTGTTTVSLLWSVVGTILLNHLHPIWTFRIQIPVLTQNSTEHSPRIKPVDLVCSRGPLRKTGVPPTMHQGRQWNEHNGKSNKSATQALFQVLWQPHLGTSCSAICSARTSIWATAHKTSANRPRAELRRHQPIVICQSYGLAAKTSQFAYNEITHEVRIFTLYCSTGQI